jgi:DNA-binding NarL/FixJ family response regulator
MTTATEPKTESLPADSDPAIDTGPQAVLQLAEEGLTTREIASRLHMHQSTVVRRIKEASQQRIQQRQALIHTAVLALCVLCAIVSTAALATIAWF